MTEATDQREATELGVARIVPIDAERTEVRLEGARLDKRVVHWRGVVASACGQCGRARLPQVGDPVAIADVGRIAPDAALRSAYTDQYARYRALYPAIEEART